MTYKAEVVRVLVASPGDLVEERVAAKEVIFDWNASHSYETKKVLLPVMWETHSAPTMGEQPQKVINRQIVSKCDIAIAIFWHHIGTETQDHISGTVEEIEQMLGNDKIVMVYFSNKEVKLSAIDIDSYQKLLKYKNNCFQNGLVSTFNSNEEFKSELLKGLIINIKDLNIKWFEDIEVDNDEVIGRVRIMENGKPDLTSDIYMHVPFTQIERDILKYVNDHGAVDLVQLINMFGKKRLMGLRKKAIIKIKDNNVGLLDEEAYKFVIRHCY